MIAHRSAITRAVVGGLTSIAMLVSGCGGGDAPPPAPVTFGSAIVTATVPVSETVPMLVSVIPNDAVLNDDVYVELIDAAGVISADFDLEEQLDGSLTATLHTSQTAPEGIHEGELLLNLCRDAVCAQHYPGSPVRLAYSVTVTAPSPAMSLLAPVLPVTAIAGQSPRVLLQIQAANRFAGADYFFEVRDALGVHIATMSVTPRYNFRAGRPEYEIPVTLPAAAAPGSQSGTFTVRMCKDADCSSYPSRTALQADYRVRTIAANHTPALVPVSGATDWRTMQGNNRRTGYAPVTVDAAAISHRWTWVGPSAAQHAPTDEVVTSGGRVFVMSHAAASGENARVYALAETDGSQVWQAPVDSYSVTSRIAADDAAIFFTTANRPSLLSTHPADLWSLSMLDGSVNFKANYEGNATEFLAPAIQGGKLYTGYSDYREGSGFSGNQGYVVLSTADGSAFTYLHLPNANLFRWSPALSDNTVYTPFESRSLYGFTLTAPTNYAFIGDLPFETIFRRSDLNTFPVLGSDNNVVLLTGIYGDYGTGLTVHTNNLLSFNLSDGSLNWNVEGSFSSTPAIKNNVMYMPNDLTQRFEARRQSDGVLMWSWPLDPHVTHFNGIAEGNGNVVMTRNVVFFCAGDTTYGLDIATREPVFVYSESGALSVSANGILYISSAGERVTAFNLR